MSRSLAGAVVLAVLALESVGCGEEEVVEPVSPEVLAEEEAEEAPVLEEPGPAEVIIEEEEEPPPVVKKAADRKPPKSDVAKREPAPAPKGMRRARLGKTPSQPKGLESRQIKRIISERIPQVRACYERELKKNSGLAGKVLVAWTIREDGSVTSPKARKNTTGNRALVPCITKAVSKWRFPKSSAPSDVEFPFVFRSKEEWR